MFSVRPTTIDGKIRELRCELLDKIYEMEDDFEKTIFRLRETIEQLKDENLKLLKEINDREERDAIEKSKIVESMKAIQSYSLDDAFDFYSKIYSKGKE